MAAAWRSRFFEESPHYWPIAGAAGRFRDFAEFPPVEAWDGLLAGGLPVRFSLQPPIPRRRPRPVMARYDSRIVLEAKVPSRPRNWHDFLNALVWNVFPTSKWALHARQHRAISARITEGATRLPTHRTRELDTLSLLDEGGVIVLSDTDLPDARSVDRALEEGRKPFLVFGHAIYEGLLRDGPEFSCTARVAVVRVDPIPATLEERLLAADRGFAARLESTADLMDPSVLPRTTIRGGAGPQSDSPATS